MEPCQCYWCGKGKAHPATYEVAVGSDHDLAQQFGALLVAESLDPRDIEQYRACTLCGHRELGIAHGKPVWER